MAKTVVIYAGGNTEYQFPFDYLRKEFVKVSLVAANGTSTDKVYGSDYTVTDRKITLKVASDATGEVRIWRSTTTNPITVFSDASVLRARTLNALDTQLLHIAEENSDAISMYGMSFDKADNTWQGMGRIIKNVKNPLNPQDAVTLNYLDSVGVARATQMEALAAQLTADESKLEVAAAAALVSEKNAKTSETNAKVSETASKNSETNAKVSETASKTSETNAKTSEENSKTSETNAKVYMEACSNGAGYTKVEMDALLKKKAGVVTYTEPATLMAEDCGKLIICNSSSAMTITTPATIDANAVIKILNLGSGTVTLAAGSGSFYAGSGVVSSPTLAQYASAEYCTDGTNWYRVGGTEAHTLDGYTAASLVSSAGGETLFTASGIFTVPTGVDRVFITGCGGGGGGGGGVRVASSFATVGYGGDGAGVTARKMITGLTPGQQIAITIGIGGAGGYSYGNSSSAGGAGGTTSFGSYASVAGGSGGIGIGGSNPGNVSGAGGSAGSGMFFNSTGGSTMTASASASGNDGIGYGAGGGGGPYTQGYYGGKGSIGMLLVEY